MEETQTKPTNLAAISSDESSVIEIVNYIIREAIIHRASDLHFEPYDDQYRVRWRIHGLLSHWDSLPLRLHQRVSSRIKIMAGMDISERRIPQDGHFIFECSTHQSIDCRISSCPTLIGEKIVIRFLNPEHSLLNTQMLGLSKDQHQLLMTAIEKPHGLILIAGPTGSGKTMTLYAILHYLNTGIHNIVTVEDPVEIKLSGINQVNVNFKAGLSFAVILRAFLRQDPDIMMIGEIRDQETAEIAIHAAQTGHLVLSTIHANSTVETITRLHNLGIPAYNIANTLSLVIAQRLVRKICPHCIEECHECSAGYTGRIGLFEMLPISPEFSELIEHQASTQALISQTKRENMMSIYESGLEKIKAGLTSLAEVKRVALEQ